jgi:hypothetical protein
MKCDAKTMIKVAAGLGVALVVAYVTLPSAHAFVMASAPLLLALACPLAMVVMMFAMKGMNGGNKDENAKPDQDRPPSPGAGELGPEKP